MFKQTALILILLCPLTLAACDNNDDVTSTAPAAGDVVSSEVAPSAPPEGPAPSIAVGEPNPSAPKECGHQDLIGKNIKDIDQSTLPTPHRVIYPDSPVTMDYNPNRLNVILEKGTDKIIEVRCS